MSHLRSYIIIYFIFLFTISVHSVIFTNLWNLCVDVYVESNSFPMSLIQSQEYFTICPSEQQHWRRFGSSEFRMNVLRKPYPIINKYIYIHHNGYVHLHNQTRLIVAKYYGAEHEEL